MCVYIQYRTCTHPHPTVHVVKQRISCFFFLFFFWKVWLNVVVTVFALLDDSVKLFLISICQPAAEKTVLGTFQTPNFTQSTISLLLFLHNISDLKTFTETETMFLRQVEISFYMKFLVIYQNTGQHPVKPSRSILL